MSGLDEGAILFLLGLNNKSPANTEDFRKSAVAHGPDIIVWPILHVTFGAVAIVVEHDDDRIELVTSNGRQFKAGHLKCAITDKDQRAEFLVGQLRTNTRGNGKAHRGVVSRSEKFGSLTD